MHATQAETATPLTALSEEERFFQSTVRQFAREQIRPHVREMDEAGVFRKDLIRQFFDIGLMGIEIPEEYGGQGGSFFQAVLAVEELSAVDPSAGRDRGCAEHHLQQRSAAVGHAGAEDAIPAAPGGKDGGVLRAVGSGIRLGCVRHGHAAPKTAATTS